MSGGIRKSRRASTAALLIGAALLFAGATVGSARAAIDRQQFTVYSVATGVQFINTADDRARGVNNNPFNADTNKLKPKTTPEKENDGPFPGDTAVYSFDLYHAATLKKRAGSASYTCYFNYAKQALCVAYYELNGGLGTVLASGPVNFNASTFRMVVTGGTSKYLGARGEVSSAPAGKNSQRLELMLLG